MKQFKHAALTLAMVGLFSAHANASESMGLNPSSVQPMVAFSQTDIDTLFVQAVQPMQLAALSQQEMRETEGAWVWNTVAWTAGGGVIGTSTYLWTTPRSQWSWGGAGRAFGSGATAGFYNSMIPLRALGSARAYTMGALGAASWYRW